jgi:HAD superfamily hydrolase (TIGR01509 family)
MIKTIAFDYAGVVAQGPVSGWLKRNVPKEDIRNKIFNYYCEKWDMGGVNLQQYYEMISEVTGTPPNVVWKTYFKNSVVNKEVIKIIKELKKNYKIVLFSNNFGELLRKVMDEQNITNLFDDIIISSEHKMVKPSLEFFNLMLLKVKNNKNEVVFVDDRQINVDASNKMGIKALLYKNGFILKKDLKDIGIQI